MDSKAHKYIVRQAIEFLPEPEKEFWSRNLSLMEVSSTYLDVFAAPSFVSEEMAKSEPDWRELVHQRIGGEEVLLHTAVANMRFHKTGDAILKSYLRRIVDALFEDDLKMAAKLAGCFSHFIGDTGQPAHAVDDEQVVELFPYPSDSAYMMPHPAVESIIGVSMRDYSPSILAANVDELSWICVERFSSLRRSVRSLVIPMLSAIYEGAPDKAQSGADLAVQLCVEFFCDLLYTLSSMNLNDSAIESLKAEPTLSISQLTPIDKFCDMMFGYAPMIDKHPDFSKKEGLAYPLVPFDLGIGGLIEGIALFPDMAPGCLNVREAFVEYEIPPGMFKRFSAIVGLNHLCDNAAAAVFEVALDGETVYTSPVLSDKTPGAVVDIRLKSASRIRLSARDSRDAPCSTAFFYPIWGNPTLIKSQSRTSRNKKQ